MLVFPMQNSVALGKSIAKHAKAKMGKLESRLFPDGEFHLQFIDDVKDRTVVLVQSLSPNPNDSLIELVFAGKTAQELGAKKVIGIVPYLAYMRQDKAFKKGECVSNHIMAHLLNTSLDKIITVDPHLHRVHDLSELFHIERRKVTANEAIAGYISKKFRQKNTVIIGPDIESSQWARRIAHKIGFASTIFLKERLGDKNVKISITHEADWRGKDVVIVDDIISSGHTMIEAVKALKKRKPKSIHCVCVHAIFSGKADEKLKAAGAKTVVSCNTITHKTNGIDVANLIAQEL